MTTFPRAISYHDKYGPAMEIEDQVEADEYFEKCVLHSMLFVENREEAEKIERSNLGYYAGYYGEEVRRRVEKLFCCVHPVFGSIEIKGSECLFAQSIPACSASSNVGDPTRVTVPVFEEPRNTMKPDKTVSAQVVLAAGGARPGPSTSITSANIAEWTPSAETIASVSGELRDAGFEVGGCVGNSISITGAVRLFESCFHTKLREVGGGVQFDDGCELASQKIPAALRAQIAAVTFSPPPDFGPGAAASFS